jgi:hypothetical protein
MEYEKAWNDLVEEARPQKKDCKANGIVIRRKCGV